MIKLDSSIPLVVVQFRCFNHTFVPRSIPAFKPNGERKEKCSKSGTLIIPPTKNCCLLELISTLKESVYDLIGAFFQEREDAQSSHIVVRFTFVRREYIRKDTQKLEEEEAEKILEGLYQICNDALWTSQVFLNPFYKDGAEVPGQRSVSINANARRLMFDDSNNRVQVWRKDQQTGERIGDEKVDLEASCTLGICDGALSIGYPIAS